MPHDGAIEFGDLTGKLDVPLRLNWPRPHRPAGDRNVSDVLFALALLAFVVCKFFYWHYRIWLNSCEP